MSNLEITLNLPYLGNNGKNEGFGYPVFFWREEEIDPWRPNYNDFKNGPSIYHSEEECVSILVGLTHVNELFNALNLKRNRSFNPNHSKFLDLISGIKKMILDGMDSGNLGYFKRKPFPVFDIDQCFDELEKLSPGIDFSDHEYNQHRPFSRDNLQIEGLSFLHWAQQCGYPIPDELKFRKDANGELQGGDLPGDIPTDEKPAELNEKENQAVKMIIEYCKQYETKNGQLPKRTEVANWLEQQLKKENNKLGPRSTLPDAIFRKIWGRIPQKYKRPQGEKTRKKQP